MTMSRASRPRTSAREKPVARSHASLKSLMRPARSRTHTSDCVVSVRIRAKESPITNSAGGGESSMSPRPEYPGRSTSTHPYGEALRSRHVARAVGGGDGQPPGPPAHAGQRAPARAAPQRAGHRAAGLAAHEHEPDAGVLVEPQCELARARDREAREARREPVTRSE